MEMVHGEGAFDDAVDPHADLDQWSSKGIWPLVLLLFWRPVSRSTGVLSSQVQTLPGRKTLGPVSTMQGRSSSSKEFEKFG